MVQIQNGKTSPDLPVVFLFENVSWLLWISCPFTSNWKTIMQLKIKIVVDYLGLLVTACH